MRFWCCAQCSRACGASQGHSEAPSHGAQAAAFKGSPPALAALHAQANKLLGGGVNAFRARMASLHGYPVVVNKWASWCGPCQIEFPAFQRAAVKYGRKVAFIGIDGKDGNGAAAAFLKRFPVTLPELHGSERVDRAGLSGFDLLPADAVLHQRPGTARYVFDHAGPYESAAALERDIRRYALK